MKQRKKYYRILDDVASSELAKKDEILEIANQISRKGQYLYIDIDEQKGFRMMEECSQSDEEEQTEQLGNHCITYFQPQPSLLANRMAYLFKVKEQTNQKQKAMKLVNSQLQKSQQKLRKSRIGIRRESPRQNHKPSRRRIHMSMDANLLENYRLEDEYDSLNEVLLKREQKLLQQYNTIPTHRPSRQPTIDNSRTSLRASSSFRLGKLLPDLQKYSDIIRL